MAVNKTINKSTKSHGAMRNCLEYVLNEAKVKDGLIDITGPFTFEKITPDADLDVAEISDYAYLLPKTRMVMETIRKEVL